jgi:hypothetical protein
MGGGMARQTRDIVSIALWLFVLLFILEMLIAVPLYGLAFLLGHGYPFSRLILFCFSGAVIGEFFVFFPLAFLTTRNLKDDPFRFSPKLKAFYRIPENVDLDKVLGCLRDNLTECQVESAVRLRATWSPPTSDDGLQTFYFRNARRSRHRSIVIELLSGWQGFREQRVEISIEPGALIKLFNSDGLNQVALQSLMVPLGWEKYRIAIDTEGNPQW